MEINYKAIGERVREARKRKGMTRVVACREGKFE